MRTRMPPAGRSSRVQEDTQGFRCGPVTGAERGVVLPSAPAQVKFAASETASGNFTVDGAQYKLLQFHFHAPSEHTVAGVRFPLEVRRSLGTLPRAVLALSPLACVRTSGRSTSFTRRLALRETTTSPFLRFSMKPPTRTTLHWMHSGGRSLARHQPSRAFH